MSAAVRKEITKYLTLYLTLSRKGEVDIQAYGNTEEDARTRHLGGLEGTQIHTERKQKIQEALRKIQTGIAEFLEA